jgi:hypothetical protein
MSIINIYLIVAWDRINTPNRSDPIEMQLHFRRIERALQALSHHTR